MLSTSQRHCRIQLDLTANLSVQESRFLPVPSEATVKMMRRVVLERRGRSIFVGHGQMPGLLAKLRSVASMLASPNRSADLNFAAVRKREDLRAEHRRVVMPSN